MVTNSETLQRELERLREQRKTYRVLHQRVPKDLERRIAAIEAQLTQAPYVRSHLNQRPTLARVLWEQRYGVGAIIFLAATAIVYVYF